MYKVLLNSLIHLCDPVNSSRRDTLCKHPSVCEFPGVCSWADEIHFYLLFCNLCVCAIYLSTRENTCLFLSPSESIPESNIHGRLPYKNLQQIIKPFEKLQFYWNVLNMYIVRYRLILVEWKSVNINS